jgi:hypothetical protein
MGTLDFFLSNPNTSSGEICTKNEQKHVRKSEVSLQLSFYNCHTIHFSVERVLMIADLWKEKSKVRGFDGILDERNHGRDL